MKTIRVKEEWQRAGVYYVRTQAMVLGFNLSLEGEFADGSYAAFGKIIEGMDVVNKIAETATDYNDRPLEDQRMKTVTVETFGVDYPEPERY